SGAAAAGRDRRRGGDSPGDRKDYAFRRTARYPVYPDNSYISVVGPAGLVAGTHEMDDPDRRADRAAEARRRGRDAARRRGRAQRHRHDDRRSSFAAKIDSLRLKYSVWLTLYSCVAR